MNLKGYYRWNVKPILYRNKIVLYDDKRKIQKNRVNLHYVELSMEDNRQNLGDWLSPIVVNYVLSNKGLSLDTPTKATHNLYAIGSILGLGYQSTTVWGSGFLDEPSKKNWYKIRKFDIRSVRGPETRNVLLSLGYKCPEVYGDPALLLPLYYTPHDKTKKFDVAVIPHLKERNIVNCSGGGYKTINILTNDWQKTVDEIYNSKLVISSSLHGIVLAEAYGIPAILWKPEKGENDVVGGDKRSMFKYNDYYHGTGRTNFPVVNNIEDAFSVKPIKLNNLKLIQQDLLETFPYDLWK